MSLQPDPKQRGKIAEIIDRTLANHALVVLDFNKDAVDMVKRWSSSKQDANYNLRESAINRIIDLFPSVEEAVKAERMEWIKWGESYCPGNGIRHLASQCAGKYVGLPIGYLPPQIPKHSCPECWVERKESE